ncbi:UNKNOWN [Stylonychia lemnae]|uniref:Methyltransferase type 11 domain-containing protein n=1 Tax=Stylonychia lemnae TaxID=5949 RepID=A0A078A1S8_STYLE|nr:UNKNOWN [Stylonychia lemnae]|eukprot:CDW76070.1 UNKNOWN [Stylonychia lemnae]
MENNPPLKRKETVFLNLKDGEENDPEDTYAKIVRKYRQSKNVPWRRFCETPSFLKLVGKLTNEDVIDLGCGEGFYTRKLRQLTTGKVFGVDFCDNFIKMAQFQQYGANDIDYRQFDCGLPIEDIPGQFDLVTPTFLVQNALSEEDLEQMVQNIWNLCKPGGRVCGLNASPFVPVEEFKKDEKYGLSLSQKSTFYFEENASEYSVRLFDKEADMDISLRLMWYSGQFYEEAFRKAGFTNFRWVQLELFEDTDNAEYWKDFLTNCQVIMYEAIKPLNKD